jgi:inosine-uridine nucleoside N-ribohydrolase
VPFLPDAETPVRSDSVDSLVALAHEDREGPLYVLAIGAATNVASALLVDPSIAERVVVVWTSAYPTFWPRQNTSFNLAQDIPAARVLLDSGAAHVYLPGYVIGEQLRISMAEVEAHVRGRGPLGDHLAQVCDDSRWFPRPGASKVIWDLVNVAWVLEPSWLPSELVPTPVLDERLFWRRQPGRHLMREAHAIQRDAIWLDLYAALDEHAATG